MCPESNKIKTKFFSISQSDRWYFDVPKIEFADVFWFLGPIDFISIFRNRIRPFFRFLGPIDFISIFWKSNRRLFFDFSVRSILFRFSENQSSDHSILRRFFSELILIFVDFWIAVIRWILIAESFAISKSTKSSTNKPTTRTDQKTRQNPLIVLAQNWFPGRKRRSNF